MDFGGAVFSTGIDASSIQNSSFTENTASDDGGAVFVEGGDSLDIRDSTFTRNIAPDRGGGVFAREFGQGFTCESTKFTDNVAGTEGGGASTSNVGPVNFTANEFVRNEAGSQGGGLFAQDDTGTTPLFTNVSNVFTDNTAPSSPNSFASGFSNT